MIVYSSSTNKQTVNNKYNLQRTFTKTVLPIQHHLSQNQVAEDIHKDNISKSAIET